MVEVDFFEANHEFGIISNEDLGLLVKWFCPQCIYGTVTLRNEFLIEICQGLGYCSGSATTHTEVRRRYDDTYIDYL